MLDVNAVGSRALGRWPHRGSKALAVVASIAVMTATSLLAVSPPSVADAAPDYSIEALQSVPVDQLRAIAQQQWDQMVANGSNGGFTDLPDSGGDDSKVVDDKNLRSVLNKAMEKVVPNQIGGLPGKFVSTGKIAGWLDTIPNAFAADTNALELAAAGTGFVKILGPLMGIAASASADDPEGIAANVVTLLGQFLGYFLDSDVGFIVGLVALLISVFILAFKAQDNDPIAWDNLVAFRDKKFADLIPEFASHYADQISAMFARLQTRVIYEMDLADAAVEAVAKVEAQADPSSGNLILTQAADKKRAMHDQTLADLAKLRSNMIATVKTAFVELITNAATNNDEITAFTDKVFPIYHTNDDTNTTAPLAWSNGPGVDTTGWHYFAVEAKLLSANGDLTSDCTTDGNGHALKPLDYSNLSLSYLWDHCQPVIDHMNEQFLPRINGLRTTPIKVPDGVEAAIDTAMNQPAVVDKFSLVAAIPTTPVTKPWAFTAPGASSTGLSRTALVSGTGQAGKMVGVRSAATGSTTVCSAIVDDYGNWACVPDNLVPPGVTTTYDLYDADGTSLGVSEPESFDGAQLALTGAPPTSGATAVADLGSLSGTGTPNKALTVTMTNKHAWGSREKSVESTVSAGGVWSLPLTSAQVEPGADVTVTIADKSIGQFVTTTFTTTSTLRIITPSKGGSWSRSQPTVWSGTGVPGDTLSFTVWTNDPNMPYLSKTSTASVVIADGSWSYQPQASDIPTSIPFIPSMELVVNDATNGDQAVVDFTAS